MRQTLKIFVLVLLTQVLWAQNSDKNERDGFSDPTLKSGRLENGFRYFVKKIDGVQQIYTSLIVNAGSSQEEKDQNNLAHLLEHMASNGTKNFPNLRGDPNFLSRMKMKPMDMLAFIGGNKTTYSFRFPKEVSFALDTSLAYYHDIASGKVLFDDEAVMGERKTLYQEHILGGNPAWLYSKLKIENSLTGRTNGPEPKDLENTIMNSSTKDLKRFYKDWYRPDLLVLTVIGDIKNTDEVVNKIREKFKDLKMPDTLRTKRNYYKNYLESSNSFMVLENPGPLNEKLTPETALQFYYRNPDIYFEKFSDKENKILWELLSSMIHNRLKSEELNYGTKFSSTIYPSEELPVIELDVKTTGEVENTIKKVFNMLAAISSYGFRNEEWETVKRKKIEYLQNRNYNSIDVWADAIENHIVEKTPLPDKNDQSDLTFLKNLDIGKINNLANELRWLPNDIAIIRPNGSKKDNFSELLIRQWINEGMAHPKRFNPLKAPQQLMSSTEISKLEKATISSRSFGDYNEDIIKLNNGVKIILKDLKPEKGWYKDKIIIHGFSLFGASCFGERDMESMFSPVIIQNSGLGNYNKFEIQKLLSNTSIPFGIRNYIEQNETGVMAEVSPEDVELALQLIYLSFTEPRFDNAAFEDWKMIEEKRFRRTGNSNNDFIDLINQENNNFKIPQGGARYWQSLLVNNKEAFRKYKALHASARNFTFILTGDFKKKTVLPLLQKYLGSLPNSKQPLRCEKSKNSKLTNFSGTKNFYLSAPVGAKFLSIQFKSESEQNSFQEVVNLELLKNAIHLMLKRLRYEQNLGVYSYSVSALVDRENNSKTIQVYLQTNEKDFAEVIESCNDVFDELRTDIIPKALLNSVKDLFHIPKLEDNKNNTATQASLYDHYRYGVPFINPEEVQKYRDNFNEKKLQQIAIEYLNANRKLVIIGSSK
ncbi:hypothetical protein C7S20_19170 [Christiangramia fulva]|uniref:Peptidase M16 n=1 Tax=Christiangramia fulva TaxID=2126553 RepID=A0A2R3ZAA0_9FLAO|nr:insulinase family protein [Christiangramia fulva]AVR47199.1 hypothetical protein C7S20_19170 [Christiangramia fulva]